jgi:hypothetical protein
VVTSTQGAEVLLPTLLPSRWTTHNSRGQVWNIWPSHQAEWTVLDKLPLLRIRSSAARGA